MYLFIFSLINLIVCMIPGTLKLQIVDRNVHTSSRQLLFLWDLLLELEQRPADDSEMKGIQSVQ